MTSEVHIETPLSIYYPSMKFQVKIADPTEERKYLYGIIKDNSDGSDGSDGFNMGMG